MELAAGSRLLSWATGCLSGHPRTGAAAVPCGGGLRQLREPRGAGAIVLSRGAPIAVSRGAN